MKKQYFILLFIIISISHLDAQMLNKHGVSVLAGFGITSNSLTTQSFSFGYQREVTKSLYINIQYTDIQGSQSFKSLLGETPKLNEFGEFGEGYQLQIGEEEDLFGPMIHINSWSLGLKKYIQLATKVQMAAGLSVVSNKIAKINIEGIVFEDKNGINYDEAHPAYGTYNTIGGKVGFEILYNLKDGVNLVSMVDYLTSESIITLSFGATVSF